ncbi:MAG: hypothetical protein P4L40_15000 [Terracidiphilus sp.]|nr:hypothetical protein [Terracidiphilus sp.]
MLDDAGSMDEDATTDAAAPGKEVEATVVAGAACVSSSFDMSIAATPANEGEEMGR